MGTLAHWGVGQTGSAHRKLIKFLCRCDLCGPGLSRGPGGADRDIVARENFTAVRAFAKQNFVSIAIFVLTRAPCRELFGLRGLSAQLMRESVSDWREVLL